MVEYHFEYITADWGSRFRRLRSKCVPSPVQACRNNKSQMWLTMGLQAQILRSLTLMLGRRHRAGGCRLPLRAASGAVEFPVWRQLPAGCLAEVTRATSPSRRSSPWLAPEGLLAGRVVSSVGTPVESAVVGVTGRDHSRVVAEADGSFQSVPLPPGPAELFVTAPNYETPPPGSMWCWSDRQCADYDDAAGPGSQITGHVSTRPASPWWRL